MDSSIGLWKSLYGGTPYVLLPLSILLAAPLLAQNVDISVRVVDSSYNPIRGARAAIYGGAIIAEDHPIKLTNEDGVATWPIPNPGGFTLGFKVSARGYLDADGPPGGFHVPSGATRVPPVRLVMQRRTGVPVTVLVSDKFGPVAGASVRFFAQGFLANAMTDTTDSSGKASFLVDQNGEYEISVVEERHEIWRGSQRFVDGMAPQQIVSKLEMKDRSANENDRLTSIVLVTVTSNGRPLPDVSVTATAHSPAITNNRGLATLTGRSAIGDQIEITASAEGYQTRKTVATLFNETLGVGRSRESSASVKIDLLPGKDPLPSSTPIQLRIKLLSSVDQRTPVPDAYVDLYFANRLKLPGAKASEDDGVVAFTIEDSPRAPLDMVRRGIRVEIDAPNGRFKDSIQSISPFQLEASAQVREIEMYLNPDNSAGVTDLLTKINSISPRIAAARAEFENLKSNLSGGAKYVTAAADARLAARAAITALNFVVRALDPLRNLCSSAQEPESASASTMNRELDRSLAAANQLDQAITLDLAQANAMVNRCSNGDAAQAKLRHNKAIQSLGQIGVQRKRVESLSDSIAAAARLAATAKDLLAKADELRASVDNQLVKATAATEALIRHQQYFQITMPQSIGNFQQLKDELQRLQSAQRGLAAQGNDIQVNAAGEKLNSLDRDLTASNPTTLSLEIVRGELSKAEASRDSIKDLAKDARDAIAISSSYNCRIANRDQAPKDIQLIFDEAESKIFAAADLPRLADQCATRGQACHQVLKDVRFLLEEGGIEDAQSRIQTARSQGCDVKQLEGEFDYFRTVRDGAVYIESLNAACRYSDAVSKANEIPLEMQRWRILRETISRAKDGAAAQQRIQAQINSAKQAAQSGNPTQAEQYLRTAESEATRYPCLASLVAAARANLPKAPAASFGSLTGQATVTPNQRDDGYSGSYTEKRYTSTSAQLEVRIPAYDNTGYTSRTLLKYQFENVPTSLEPGKSYTIRVSGRIDYTPKSDHDGMVFGSSLEVRGHATVTGPGAKRGPGPHNFVPGDYIVTVSPTAKTVEIYLGGAGVNTIAIWKYGN